MIEETISYIDALHRRIAERFGATAPTLTQEQVKYLLSGHLMLHGLAGWSLLLQVEEAESGALSLEDTGDFASRLAALSTSRTGTSISDNGSDSEDKGILNAGMQSQKKSIEETSINEEKMSVEHGDQVSAKSDMGEGEPSEQKELPEGKVQQVVDAVQDSFLQMLEAGKEDLVEKLDGFEAKQDKKQVEKHVVGSGQIEDTT